MQCNQEPKVVYSIWNIKDKLNLNPDYQRGPVWSEASKQLLMDTILRGYDMPKLYWRALDNTSDYEYEVVDGQQRIRTLLDFKADAFPLGPESHDLPMGDISGKYFSDLSSDIQEKIGGFSLTVTVIRNSSENEIRELFLRLQEGKTLNPAEKRNAMTGGMRDFIAKLAKKHNVFSKLRINNARFEYDDWAAHITSLELNGGATDIKAANLKKMYEDNKDFTEDDKKAKKINKVLNYLNKVLDSKPPEMKIKWGFVDMYLLISTLIEKYDIKDRHTDFLNFFIGFEKSRNEVNDPADLLETGSEWDKDLYAYIQGFTKEGAKRKSIEIRNQVYVRRFLSDYKDLASLDPRRNFDSSERIILYRNSHGKCNSCNKKIPFEQMHADHVKPYSKGGSTSLSNGQCLCEDCNRAKSNKL